MLNVHTSEEHDAIEYQAWLEMTEQLFIDSMPSGLGDSIKPSMYKVMENRGLSVTFRTLNTGPWRNVRQYCTGEYIRWIEDEGGERLSWSQFRAQRRQQRAAERAQQFEAAEWNDSPAHALQQLEELRELQERRDELIIAARTQWSSAEVEAAAGLSRMQIHRVVAGAREDALAAVAARVPAALRKSQNCEGCGFAGCVCPF